MTKIPDIKGAKVLICGLQGGGKTFKAKQIVKSQNLRVLVYSPHRHDFANEPDNFMFYQSTTDFVSGFSKFCELAKQLCMMGEIDGIFVDEFDMIFQTNFDVTPIFIDLTCNHRHYNMTIIGITRRPQDIPTRFTGSCKLKIVFALDEDNAIKKFNQQYANWGKQIAQLNYRDYKFYLKEIGRPPVLCSSTDV